MNENFWECQESHPNTGEPCSKHVFHNDSEDVRRRQHATKNGLKWPHLAVLDPAEGYNGPMPRYL